MTSGWPPGSTGGWGGGYSGAGSHRFEALMALISPSEAWHASERVGSGMVGTGGGLELSRYRHAGDGVELDIETIGILRHRFLKVVPYVRRCQFERRADTFLNATGRRYEGVSQRYD